MLGQWLEIHFKLDRGNFKGVVDISELLYPISLQEV